MTSKRALTALAIVALVALFLIANRGAYQGSFSDDDLDNISWTGIVSASTYIKGLLSPVYYAQHFRPIGHGTFDILSRTAGMNFRWYIAVVHVLHLLTTAALLLLLLRLGLPHFYAAAGALLFLFPMAAFDALWKPMYLFDVWCGLFSVLTMLAYASRRTILALVFFWLAYKSKEQAVMLPVVLAAYEYWLGERRWKRLLPFFAIAAIFATQALIGNRNMAPHYQLQLTAPAILQTTSFYLSRFMIYSYLGIILIIVLLRFAPDRRVWFGLTAAVLLLGPMLLLPTRMSTAYLYVPLAALVIAVAAASQRLPKAAVVFLVLIWGLVIYEHILRNRKAALALAHENQAYLAALSELAAGQPALRRFVYDGNPPGMREWGIRGALRLLYRDPNIDLHSAEEPQVNKVFDSGPVALLAWMGSGRQLTTMVHKPGDADASYLSMQRIMPIWQLESGWFQSEGTYRWTRPQARARLLRPADVREFAIEVNINPAHIAAVKRLRIEVMLDGVLAGAAEFTTNGWQTGRVPLKPAPPGVVEVELRSTPEFRPSAGDPRALGAAVAGFGFR